MSGADDTLIVGTRGSLLARAQTDWVIERLKVANPGLAIRIEVITTAGDRDQTRPLPEVGAKGLFTAEIEQSLLNGAIDLAVHSAKDLQSVLPPGLEIIAYPEREDPRDAWISAGGVAFDDVPAGSAVGTSSLRRQAQLLMRRPDLMFVTLRGNVDTRIRKVQQGQCAGAVLAMAGLKRSGLAGHVTHPFEPSVCLPAPGQGAIAIEGRADDERVRNYVRKIDDEATRIAVTSERAILAEMDAGCRAPVAIYAQYRGTMLHCEALVADPQGGQCVRAAAEGPMKDLAAIARNIVDQLRLGGADAIIAACRE